MLPSLFLFFITFCIVVFFLILLKLVLIFRFLSPIWISSSPFILITFILSTFRPLSFQSC